ncbi:MAG TPA: DUF3124 domain-containing protein [Candidatus Ozemobacteraceae bacterium]|nr:DUF3124 domain-containing protein [Candidatus Ozemobacteraceae bacterium]
MNGRAARSGRLFLFLFAVILLTAATPGNAHAQTASGTSCPAPARSLGQEIYIPIYSHIFFGDAPAPFNLTSTLSIRNTDRRHAIQVISANYHDTDGRLIREYLPKPVLLAPLASTNCLVPESDTAGGIGASFIVRWRSAIPVDAPLVEAVMIGTRGQQGISFISRGQVLSAESDK